MMTELERLKVLSALKLGYGKLTAKNTTEKEFENIEQAIEIVKKLTIPVVVGQSEQLKPKEQICYKSNEPCKYDCSGLCRESC